MYVFLRTYNSSRGGLCVGMLTVDKKGFLDELNRDKGKYSWETWRYAKLGGVTHHMKDMLLPEFEEIFREDELTEEQIDKMFRKEVAEKYGRRYKEIAKQKKIPAIKKKDLILGGVYLDDRGYKYAYMGYVKVKKEFYHMKGYSYWSQQKDRKNGRVEEYEGYLYIGRYYLEKENFNDMLSLYSEPNLLKTRKRFVEFTGQIVEIQKEYIGTRCREFDYTIEFTEVE